MIEVRSMSENDVPDVAEIEEKYFSEPWSEKSIKDFLKHEYAHFYVAESEGSIAGYIGAYEAGDSMDITNVAVSDEFRRCGIGGMLVKQIIKDAKGAKCTMVSLEVRESNEKAIKLYEKEGFSYVGIRKNFYSKPTENAIIYQYVF